MPVTTVNQLISDSMKEVQAIAAGETPTAAEAQDCLTRLNRMIASWNTERLSIFTIKISAYTLVPNQQVYTIGPGGDFDDDRPQSIEEANIILNTVSPSTRQPLALLNDLQWSLIRVQNVPNTIPQALYNDGAYPLSNLYLWGYPTGNLQLELYTWQQLSQFTALTQTVSFPPGYEEAIMYGLSVRIAPMFGVEVSPITTSMAQSSKAAIQRLNLPSPVMVADPAVAGVGRASEWNYITGLNNGGQN